MPCFCPPNHHLFPWLVFATGTVAFWEVKRIFNFWSICHNIKSDSYHKLRCVVLSYSPFIVEQQCMDWSEHKILLYSFGKNLYARPAHRFDRFLAFPLVNRTHQIVITKNTGIRCCVLLCLEAESVGCGKSIHNRVKTHFATQIPTLHLWITSRLGGRGRGSRLALTEDVRSMKTEQNENFSSCINCVPVTKTLYMFVSTSPE